MSLLCGSGPSVNVDRSTVNTDRVQTRPVVPGYGLGFGPPHGMLCHCHVVAKGLHWASVHRSAHTAWLMVDWCSRSMDCRLGLRWTESILLPFGLVHVHRVHVCVAGEGDSSASFPSVLLLVVCSLASSHSGAGVQLRWGKASPGLGEYGGGVKVAARAS